MICVCAYLYREIGNKGREFVFKSMLVKNDDIDGGTRRFPKVIERYFAA